jgi:uncharacterized membrane protein YbhN (UPF0104 family)
LKLAIRVLLSLLVAALLLYVLARWGGVGVQDVRAALARLPLGCYLGALGLHVLLYLLRTLRFQVLTPPAERPGFAGQLGVCLAHGMASIVLPAKVGELAYVVYSGKALGLRGETALAALVVARLLDLATLALGMGVACMLAPGPAWLLPMGAGALALALALFALSWRGEWLVRIGVWASRALQLQRWSLGARAIEKVEGLGGALEQAARGHTLWKAIVLSLAAWACVFLFCAVLARGLGIGELGLAQATFGSGVAIATSLLPLSAFASFGTLEAGWVIGFGVVGVGRDLALATGTGLHVVQLVNVVALGLIGHVLMGLCGKPQRG